MVIILPFGTRGRSRMPGASFYRPSVGMVVSENRTNFTGFQRGHNRALRTFRTRSEGLGGGSFVTFCIVGPGGEKHAGFKD